jgi:hypothetical protein
MLFRRKQPDKKRRLFVHVAAKVRVPPFPHTKLGATDVRFREAPTAT